MKKLLLFLLLILSSVTWSQQTGHKVLQPLKNDTVVEKLKNLEDSINMSYQQQIDTASFNRNIQNTIDVMHSLDQQNKIKKRNAMIRIGIGLAMLVVLFIGLRRRRSQKSRES